VLLIELGKRFVLAGVVAGLLAVLAIGCGGSSDAAPLKKPQFVAQAEEICATAQTEQDELGKEFAQQGESDGSEDTEAVMQEILEPVETMTEDLADLGPPKGQEKEVEAIIAAYEAGIAKLEAEPAGEGTVSAFDKANKLAEAYGLYGCTI
jgi:hypothetical protein